MGLKFLTSLFTSAPNIKMTVEEVLKDSLKVIYHNDDLYQISKSISWLDKRLSFLHIFSVFRTIEAEHRDVFLNHVGRRLRCYAALFNVHSSLLANVDVYMLLGLLFDAFGVGNPSLRAEACEYYMHSISSLYIEEEDDEPNEMSEKKSDELFDQYTKGLLDVSRVGIGEYIFDLDLVPAKHAKLLIQLCSRIFRSITVNNKVFDEGRLIAMFEKCEELLNGAVLIELTLDFLQAICVKKKYKLVLSIYGEIINNYIENVVSTMSNATDAVRPINSWLCYCFALNNSQKKKKTFGLQLKKFIEFLRFLIEQYDVCEIMAIVDYWKFDIGLKECIETWIALIEFQLEIIDSYPLNFTFEYKAQTILLYVIYLYHSRSYDRACQVLSDYSEKEGFKYILSESLALQYALVEIWTSAETYEHNDLKNLRKIENFCKIVSTLLKSNFSVVYKKLHLFSSSMKSAEEKQILFDLMANLQLDHDCSSIDTDVYQVIPDKLIKPLLTIPMDSYPLEIYQFFDVRNINKMKVV